MLVHSQQPPLITAYKKNVQRYSVQRTAYKKTFCVLRTAFGERMDSRFHGNHHEPVLTTGDEIIPKAVIPVPKSTYCCGG